MEVLNPKIKLIEMSQRLLQHVLHHKDKQLLFNGLTAREGHNI